MNNDWNNGVEPGIHSNSEMSVTASSGLAVQDLILLFQAARNSADGRVPEAEHLDESTLYEAIKRAILHAETLYIAYDVHTNYPYIGANDQVWVFTEERFSAEAADYYLQQFIQLEMRRIGREEIRVLLAELHVLGIPGILVDNGQNTIVIRRDELLPPPDWSGTPEISIPVSNPGLQYAMLSFFQGMYSRQQYEGKNQVLRAAEARMLDELVQAKFLVPMQLKEEEPSAADEQGRKTLQQGTVIQFASLGAENGESWLPVFTDWLEFEKGYDKTVWSANVSTYEDIVALSENMAGAAINFRGIGFRLDEKNKRMIAEYLRERG
ncbi:SseB family protein [Paenibacillus sp. PK3_47]|uniref:SseB family protein n=1 Tax=Paenibacillus sp. PK3_47 TaxID=2072642 RepID=UPI00201D3706|nr:SseB family protein [Paenibacillus sp. PK3_47]